MTGCKPSRYQMYLARWLRGRSPQAYPILLDAPANRRAGHSPHRGRVVGTLIAHAR